jgi:hypothetical protein
MTECIPLLLSYTQQLHQAILPAQKLGMPGSRKMNECMHAIAVIIHSQVHVALLPAQKLGMRGKSEKGNRNNTRNTFNRKTT